MVNMPNTMEYNKMKAIQLIKEGHTASSVASMLALNSTFVFSVSGDIIELMKSNGTYGKQTKFD